MKNLSLGLLLVLTFAMGICHAKSKTERIEVSRGKAPLVNIEGADADQITIWSGTGTTMTAADGTRRTPTSDRDFADWTAGAVEAPREVQTFNVSFYCKACEPARSDTWRCYSVRYAPGRNGERGYIQIPPAGDDDYEINVRTIYRGVEGQWFRASERWEALVRPRIEAALAAERDANPVRYTPVYTPPPQRTAVGAKPSVTPKK
jgi:hypothetical protein